MSETPERSTGPFTHKASTQRFGKTVTTENTICDADGNTLISEWYSSWWDSENTQEVDLAPGDWHLFAAAPEMLEALKALRSRCWGGCSCTDPSDEENAAWDLAEAAVAKAEGRTP